MVEKHWTLGNINGLLILEQREAATCPTRHEKSQSIVLKYWFARINRESAEDIVDMTEAANRLQMNLHDFRKQLKLLLDEVVNKYPERLV